MISEKTFSAEFSGFWAECLPFLTPQAIAELNLSGTVVGHSRREWMKPLSASEDSSNNDIIAETAFGLFAESLTKKVSVQKISNDKTALREITKSAKARVLDLRREIAGKPQTTFPNINEAITLASRLEAYFRGFSKKSITVQPRFRGCGIVNSCYGDLLAKGKLIELKMVDRNLRSADIRQLLVYCALNHHSSQYKIDSVVILNPRRGLEFSFDVEEIADRASGKTSAELFHEITTFISDFETLHQPS